MPNLYIILSGHPGTGKTRTIRAARAFLQELPDFHFAPKSFTFPSLVDKLAKAKRMIVRLPDAPLEYNIVSIIADELGTFMHKFDEEMSKGLSALYDQDVYDHSRRGKEIDIKIKSPLVNILCGCTPTDLLKTMPESAWGQGFTSRVIFIFSDERIVSDMFANVTRSLPTEMVSDLKHLSTIVGEFKVTEEYQKIFHAWRLAGETLPDFPAPTHPKLIHYNSRRRVNLLKLSMISAIDRSDVLLLTRDDFNRAMGWLVEAESLMPEIFKAGVQGADAAAMEEIYHYIMTMDSGKGVSEHKITAFAQKRLPIHSIGRMYEVMERSGMIRPQAKDRFGIIFWRAIVNSEQATPKAPTQEPQLKVVGNETTTSRR